MHAQFSRMIMSHCAAQEFETVDGTSKEEPQPQASGLIGTTLDGAYRITRLIAEGGMSAVYEAVQLRMNQRVSWRRTTKPWPAFAARPRLRRACAIPIWSP